MTATPTKTAQPHRSPASIAALTLAWLAPLAILGMATYNALPYLRGALPPLPLTLLEGLLTPPGLAPPRNLAPLVPAGMGALLVFLLLVLVPLTFWPHAVVPVKEPLAPTHPAPVDPPTVEEPTLATAPVEAAPVEAPPESVQAIAAPTAPTPPESRPLAPQGEGVGGEAPTSPRVFISHSSADNSFGVKVERRLKEKLGEDAVFYDSDGGLVGGDVWPLRLQREIQERDVFVLILSPEAFASRWVEAEFMQALRQERSVGGKAIVPVLHEETDAWPWLLNYQWVRFTERLFDDAFAELLEAVRLGHSRMAETAGLRGEREGPPFEMDALPAPGRFVGRVSEIDWALRRLAPELLPPRADAPDPAEDAEKVAAIAAANGLAGIGKSALAGRLARILYETRRYPDGIAVVACNGLTDPVAVLKQVLRRFDPLGSEPKESDLDGLRRVARNVFGQGRRALVVLDNVEPEWDVQDVTAPLREAGAALLLTSRQPLPTAAIPASASRELELLAPDEALDVFIENYQQGGDPPLDDARRAAIARIVAALGLHTLAVKLAAPRARGRLLATVAHEYETNPRLALMLREKQGKRTEAVEVVMESSVVSLPPAARRLFAALSAFAALDIGRKAALTLAEEALEDRDAGGSLAALEDLRLVDPYGAEAIPPDAEDEEDSADRDRLRLHPLVRAYARDLFDAERTIPGDTSWTADERQRVFAAIAEWYANYASVTANEAKDADERNILGALAWCATHSADRPLARICDGMASYWDTRGRTDDRKRYLPLAVEAARRLAAGQRIERRWPAAGAPATVVRRASADAWRNPHRPRARWGEPGATQTLR